MPREFGFLRFFLKDVEYIGRIKARDWLPLACEIVKCYTAHASLAAAVCRCLTQDESCQLEDNNHFVQISVLPLQA
jgi:hypothetical protein